MSSSSQPSPDSSRASQRGDDDRAALNSMLKRAARGDQDAWRILIETYSSRVFGLIRAQCGSADLAEEITQSAFCTVVSKIDSYSEVGKFEQWLFRIAVNRLRDEMRRRKRQARPTEDQTLRALADAGGRSASSGGVGASPATTGDLAGLTAAGPEQLAALRIALADLPDADQQIIHLRHSAGLSFKEIADVLEQPLGTVLARQHRALKKLAEVLRPVVEGESAVSLSRPGVDSRDHAAEAADSGTEGVEAPRKGRKGRENEGLQASGP